MASATAQAAVYRAIADPARRTILDLLRAGERAVVELLQHFEFSQPALSKHLRVLRDARLVTMHKVGRENRYRLEARGLRAVYDWVGHYEQFWNARLDRLGDVLDELGDGDAREATERTTSKRSASRRRGGRS